MIELIAGFFVGFVVGLICLIAYNVIQTTLSETPGKKDGSYYYEVRY